MKMTRRDFIKSQAIAAATASAGIALPVSIANAADKADDGMRWDKTACRQVNKLTLDATDPLSKETDYKKCACKVLKA